MKKLVSLIVVLALVGLANAVPVSFSDSLTGYTGSNADGTPNPVGSSEDLETVNQLAANGLEPGFIWGNGDGIPDLGGSGAYEKVVFDASGATFGTGKEGDPGRNYIRTVATDYNTASFIATVTVHVSDSGSQNIFMGMGTGQLGWYGTPDWGTGDSLWAEVMGGNVNVLIQDDGAYTFDQPAGDEITAGSIYGLKLVYDAVGMTARFSVDADNDGVYDYTTAVNDVSALFTGGEAASIFIGGDDGVTMTDLSVVVPEPATMALLALGGLGLIRRRK